MVLDEKSGWALIPGSAKPKETKMKVEAVLRFWNAGKMVEPGEEVEVDDSVGREVISSGKAKAVEAPVPEAAAVSTKVEAKE